MVLSVAVGRKGGRLDCIAISVLSDSNNLVSCIAKFGDKSRESSSFVKSE